MPPKNNFYYILIFLLGFFISLISYNIFIIKWWDETVYVNLAKNLLENSDYSFRGKWGDYNTPIWWDKAGTRPPILPVLISAFYYLFGISDAGLNLLISIIGGLTLIAVYSLSNALFGNRIALHSAILFAVTPFFILHSGRILTDVLVTLLTTFSLLAFWIGFEKNKNLLKFIAGILAGLAALTKFNALILPIIFFLYLFLRYKFGIFSNKYVFLIFVTFLIIQIPWLVYAYNEYGTPVAPYIHITKGASFLTKSYSFSDIFRYPILFFTILFGISLIWLLFNIKNVINSNKIIFLFIWFFLVFFSVILINQSEERYFLIGLPPAIIIFTFIFDISKKLKQFSFNSLVLPIILIIFITTSLWQFIINYNYSHNSEINKCFLMATEWLKNTPDDTVVFTDSSPIVYYYSNKEARFYPQEFSDILKLANNKYIGKEIYVLWAEYDKPKDFRSELNNSRNFKLVFKCPENGNLALIYKYKS